MQETAPMTADGKIDPVWTIRDGKGVRFQWFHAPGDALKAAGLSQ